ncbi:unnamed protein product [Trichobilharzia regenti]|nr:unnamed protein product [Trichobilharzia regenti]
MYSDGFRSTPPPPAYSSLKHIIQPPPAYSEIQSIDLSKQCVNPPTNNTDVSPEVLDNSPRQEQLQTTLTTITTSPPSYSEVVLSRSIDRQVIQAESSSETEAHTSSTDTVNTPANPQSSSS